MIVVDANVIVYRFIAFDRMPAARERTAAARRELRRDPKWIVPPRWRSEFRSAALAYLRVGFVTKDDAAAAYKHAVEMFAKAERDPDCRAVWDAVEKWEIDAYDAEYVALHLTTGARILTNDRRTLADRVPADFVQHLIPRAGA